MLAEEFQQLILAWFDDHGRKDLPWQKNITPYQTWLSEVMLQQTQVSTVIPYFNQFIQRFPNVHQLAAAPLDAVLHLWSGLGYYARARNLHKTAAIVSAEGGEFPNELEALMKLPGIGRSTAGAILSIAFNNSHAILDGNVRRVLARFHAIAGWPGENSVSKLLWEISENYTPLKRCADYTQAMMDLGAMVCTRHNPKCGECPLSSQCAAYLDGNTTQFPGSKPTKVLPVKQIMFLLLQNQLRQIYLEKRPPSGVWGGLWSFPEFDSINEIESWCVTKGIEIKRVKLQQKQRHTFSHYHLDYTLVEVETENLINNVMEAERAVWYKTEQITDLGLPAPVKALLQDKFL